MSDLKQIEEYGPAGGIDQSEKPRPFSAQDACNVQTCNGRWESRPGYRRLFVPGSIVSVDMLAEYVPDHRYDSSHYYALLVAGSASASDPLRFSEAQNTETVVNHVYPGDMDINMQVPLGLQLSHVSGLWKYYNANGVADYTPVTAITSGIDIPAIYHQKDGAGKFEYLDAIDGGDSDISYLKTPPIAKYFVVYKERLFALNLEGAGNRLAHTGPDESGVWVVNVWPTGYNLDVGEGGNEITGAVVWRDVLYIFKEHSTWALSGDGIGGLWQIEQIDGQHGALNHFCIADVGDSIITMNRDGVYRMSGGALKRVSHPRIKKTWDLLSWGQTYYKKENITYDSENNRVLCMVGINPISNNVTLAYNLTTDTWDRWGEWDREIGTPSLGATYNLGMARELDYFSGHGKWLVGSLTVSSGVWILGNTADASAIVVPWFIKTQRHFASDSGHKLLRRAMLRIRKTAGRLLVIAMPDEDGFQNAYTREAGGVWNIMVDSASSDTHDIDKAREFAAGAAVDVMSLKHGTKAEELTLHATQPGATNDIKFTASVSTAGRTGILLIVADGSMDRVFRDSTIADPATVAEDGVVSWRYDHADTKYDTATFYDPPMVKATLPFNVSGRSFALYLSNHTGETSAPAGLPLDMEGWGMWIRPLGVTRD